MPSGLPLDGVPAIFEYIPYRKSDMVRARDERNHPWLAQNGYVSLRVDMRGSGDSDGVMPDMYSQEELDDARAVIDWIAAQDWCNGHVGMFGTSWGGTASLQACLDPPPALKTIIAVCATHDRYEDDIHHMGGCLITDTLEWGATMPSVLALPPTPHSGHDWFARWTERLETLSFPVETWVREEARGAYWRHGSIKEQTHRIGCPVLAVGGWADRYSNSVMSLVDACPENVWGIVGPWGHHYPDHGHPGPAMGFQHVALEWWDQWLKPTDPGEPDWPKLRVWMREFETPENAIDLRAGAWVQSGPAGQETEAREFWLGDRATLTQTKPDESLAWTVPSDLRHGMAAGDTGYFGRFGGLPLEQSEDDARALCFDSAPLSADMKLYGAAGLTLTVAAQARRSHICVRLNDVSPDGVSSRVSLAVVNLALDDALDAPDEPHDGGPRQITVKFPTNAYRFKAGHRLRVSVATSYWPIVWTPPQIGSVEISEGTLRLPVLPHGPMALDTPLPDAAAMPQTACFDVLSAPRLQREQKTEDNGEIITGWHQPLSSVRYNDIETVFSYETRAEHRIHPDDPCSAVSVFNHEMTLDRPDGQASVTSRLRTTSDPDAYHLAFDFQVSWSGEMIFERQWTQSIARRFS